jgi:hypothetical protein
MGSIENNFFQAVRVAATKDAVLVYDLETKPLPTYFQLLSGAKIAAENDKIKIVLAIMGKIAENKSICYSSVETAVFIAALEADAPITILSFAPYLIPRYVEEHHPSLEFVLKCCSLSVHQEVIDGITNIVKNIANDKLAQNWNYRLNFRL